MSSAVFETIKALEAARLHFFIMRTRPDALTLSVTIVGERSKSTFSRMIISKSRAFAAMNPSRAAKSCWRPFCRTIDRPREQPHRPTGDAPVAASPESARERL